MDIEVATWACNAAGKTIARWAGMKTLMS